MPTASGTGELGQEGGVEGLAHVVGDVAHDDHEGGPDDRARSREHEAERAAHGHEGRDGEPALLRGGRVGHRADDGHQQHAHRIAHRDDDGPEERRRGGVARHHAHEVGVEDGREHHGRVARWKSNAAQDQTSRIATPSLRADRRKTACGSPPYRGFVQPTGYFVEYSGDVVKDMSMEGRLTLCNLSIEMGARGGFVAPDETTFEYIKGREYAPKGEEWDKAVAYWKTLKSGDDAVFDKELTFEAKDIEPRITYGTNPGMGIGITGNIPTLDEIPEEEQAGFKKSLNYMGFQPGEKLEGHPIDYVFLGACTNGRIEDFRAFASLVKGKKKADGVTAWLVPGSWLVDKQIREEGIDKIVEAAGFEIRQPGCSACLAMNDDKIPAGKYSVSTSNRNFEGRQGPGSRTILASPYVAAAAAITGKITDPREFM